jgi:hypothetical protein
MVSFRSYSVRALNFIIYFSNFDETIQQEEWKDLAEEQNNLVTKILAELTIT